MADPNEDQTQIADSSSIPQPKGPPAIPGIRIDRAIGAGGMGAVYLGVQEYLNRPVAVKVLKGKTSGSDEEFARRFEREAKILASLSHPHIVACYQAGTTPDGECFLVMEYIDGPNLQDYLTSKGPIDGANALRLVRELASALDYARGRGIIHRDVKPENVLLCSSESTGNDPAFPYSAKLVDLGLARTYGEGPSDIGKITTAGVILGTPATMAPEQFNAADDVDYRADIYGLGCVLFVALTGRRAFPQTKLTEIMLAKSAALPPDPRQLRPGIPEEAALLTVSLLQSDREARPQTYREIMAICARTLGISTSSTGAPQLSGPMNTPPTVALTPSLTAPAPSQAAPTAAPNSGKSFAPVALSAVVLVLVGVIVALSLRPGQREPAPAGPAPAIAAATATPTPAPTPQPTFVAVPTPRPVRRVEFGGSPIALLGADVPSHLAGWSIRSGAGNWVPADESKTAVDGSGGYVRQGYPFRTDPFRVEGEFSIITDVAGIEISVGKERFVAQVSRLDDLSLVLFKKGQEGTEDDRLELMSSATLPESSEKLSAENPLQFVAERHEGLVILRVGSANAHEFIVSDPAGEGVFYLIHASGAQTRADNIFLTRPR